MFKNRLIFLILFSLIILAAAIGSASASDSDIFYQGISPDEGMTLSEDSSGIVINVQDVSNDFNGNSQSNLDLDDELVYNDDLIDVDDIGYQQNDVVEDSDDIGYPLDDGIVNSNSNNKPNLKSDDLDSSNVIYFDAYAENDGNGSLDNPYKYLNPDRILPNVTAYFTNGTYYLNGTCLVEGAKLIGDGNAIINSKVTDRYDFINKENSSFEIINMTLISVQILNQGTLKANEVLFESNDRFNLYDAPEMGPVSGIFNKTIGAVIVCDTPSNVRSTVDLYRCDFENIYDGFIGGIIAGVNADINISRTSFLRYSSIYKGGAIYCLNSSLNIFHSTFNPKTGIDFGEDFTADKHNNYTSYYGGTVFCENSNLTLNQSSITGSLSYSFGGVLAALKSNITVESTEFNLSQSFRDGGGAIYNSKGNLSVEGSKFNNNSAEFGGAICSLNSILDSSNSEYANNFANYYGGVIYDIYGTLNLTGNGFTNSHAMIGGSIYSRIPNSFDLHSNSFDDSYAKDGPAIFFDGKKESSDSSFISGQNSVDEGQLIVPLNSTGLEMLNTFSNNYTFFVEFTANDYYGVETRFISNPLFYQVSPGGDAILYTNAPNYCIEDDEWDFYMMISDRDDINHASIATDYSVRNITANISFSNLLFNPRLNFYLYNGLNSNLREGNVDDLSYLVSDYYLIGNYSIDLSNEDHDGITKAYSLDFGNPLLNIKYDNLYEAISFNPVSLVNYETNSSSSSSSSGSPSSSSHSGQSPITSSSYNSDLLISYINLDDFDSISPVKNQGDGGNCWAFAGLATLEACLKKATGITFDFSEENAKNLMAAYSVFGLRLETNYGGYDSMLMSYLASWLGPIDESIEDYDDYSSISVQSNPMFHIQNIRFLPSRSSSSDNDIFKSAIRENGAVAVTIKWGRDYHAVSLVGWDDDYVGYDSLGNYARGAWIFKNSWGSDWGYNGFGYLSYEQDLSEELEYYMHAYTFIFNDTNPYTKIYQYDFAGVSVFYPIIGDIYYKNVFVADNDSILSAFSTYFDMDTNFTVMVYRNDALVFSQEGFSTAGYYTVPFHEAIELAKGDEFAIAIKSHNAEKNSIPVCLAEEITKKTFMPNVSFISYDGVEWFDLYDYANDCQVACIKAFTQNADLTKIKLNANQFNSVKTKVISLKIDFDDFDGIHSLDYCLLKCIVNNETYYAQIKDGKATINLNLKEGINSLFIQYKDNVYESNIVQFNFTVNSNPNNQSFNALQDLINNAPEKSVISLDRDYSYDSNFDNDIYGVIIDKALTINGNGHWIDGMIEAPPLFISASNVVLNNIGFRYFFGDKGGALHICGGNVKINNCKFFSSNAGQGGAIYSLSNISICNCSFTQNSAVYGGALYLINSGRTVIQDSLFGNNKAAYDGSAVYIMGDGSCEFISSNFTANEGSMDYDMNYVSEDGEMIVAPSSSFTEYKRATYFGGAVVSNVYSNNFTKCVFSHNCARYGAAVSCSAQINEFNKCRFSDNIAITSGGAISGHNTINVHDCDFINNKVTISSAFSSQDQFGGGAIYSFDNLNVYNSIFSNNHANIHGGAIYASKYLNIFKSKFINSSALKGSGGAIYGSYFEMITFNMGLLKFTELSVHETSFENNSAGKYGGAIYDSDLSLNAFYSNFTNNSAITAGAIAGANLIKNCRFANNSATDAGAIFSAKLIDGSIFIENSASNYGGAIGSALNMTVKGSRFENNRAGSYGGAIHSQHNMNISSSTFNKNSARSYGGAISSYIFDNASEGGAYLEKTFISFCNFSNNYAMFGGAISSSEKTDVRSSRFINNSASDYGGAIVFEKTMSIYDSSFVGGSAVYGGVIFAYENLTASSCNFSDNNADFGGVIFSNGSIVIDDSIFNKNHARSSGGAIYSTNKSMAVGNSQFKNNFAVYGGAIFALGETILKSSNFTRNSAQYGGAIHLDGDAVDSFPYANISSCGFTENSAEIIGAAIASRADCNIQESNFDYNSVSGHNSPVWGSSIYSNYRLNITGSNLKSNQMGAAIYFAYYYDDDNACNGELYLKDNHIETEDCVGVLYAGRGVAYNLPLYLTFKDMDSIRGESISICQLEDADGTSFYCEGMDNLYMVLTNLNDNSKTSYDLVFNETAGAYVLKVPYLDFGDYQITGTILDEFPGTYSVKSGALNIVKKSIISASDLTKEYGKSDKLLVTLRDEFGNLMSNAHIDFILNGKTVSAYTNANGQVSFAVDNAPNVYSAAIRFAGNGSHSNASLSIRITVNKAKTNLIANKKTFKITDNIKSYSIILKDNLGHAIMNSQVKIRINGKTYTAKTNSAGKAVFKLSGQFKKGMFNAVVTYAGNVYCTSISKTVKISIKKVTPKITASKKTFKLKAKTKKYSITLKDNSGKAIKKSKVKIKVNGKTYTAKTNNKGKAIFKLTKLKKIGSFKSTVSYAGNKYYNKISKKVLIVVKK